MARTYCKVNSFIARKYFQYVGAMWAFRVIKHQQSAFTFQLMKRQSFSPAGQIMEISSYTAGAIKQCYLEPSGTALLDKHRNAVRCYQDFKILYYNTAFLTGDAGLFR